MNEWKTVNPSLKILISVGGWTEGSTNFNSIVLTDQSRTSFCSQVVRIAREYDLDGFDIDW
jgi:chitinase